jgi:hypothetical protein
MKKLKLGLLIIALSAIIAGCEKVDSQKDFLSLKGNTAPIALSNLGPMNSDCGTEYTTDLVYGRTKIKVGEVTIWVDGNLLKVKYEITDGAWTISETHLAVENEANNIPLTRSGSPKIGNFEFSNTHNPAVSVFTYEIPINGLTDVNIAAHAVVMTQSGETCLAYTEIEAMLPAGAVGINFVYTRINSYYDLTLDAAGEFTGTHLAWCADNNGKPVSYSSGTLISSYNPDLVLLGAVVPHPENLDLLNYLMNNYFPETPFKLLQAAIWNLINDKVFTGGGGIGTMSETELAQVATIIAEVKANGEGFIPQPGDYLVILVHSGNRLDYQNVFFLERMCTPVYSDETAWASGTEFPGADWSMYFGYCVQ